MKRQQKDQTEGVTEDDLNEIKQDVSAFRYGIPLKELSCTTLSLSHSSCAFRFELLEILSTNGFKVQSMKKNPGLYS